MDFVFTLATTPVDPLLVDELRLQLSAPGWLLSPAAEQLGEGEDRFGPGALLLFTPAVSADRQALTATFDLFLA